MKTLSFLLSFAKRQVLLAAVAGGVGGAFSAGVIALVNTQLQRLDKGQSQISPGDAALFLACTVLVLACQAIAQFASNRLAFQVAARLRMQLITRLVRAPLALTERTGPARLVAALTDDVNGLANAIVMSPSLAVNFALTGGCLVHLGWMSSTGLLALLAMIVVAIAIVEGLERRAVRVMQRAREHWDAVAATTNAIVFGIKELKLHRTRREWYLTERVTKASDQHQADSIHARDLFGLASVAGNVLVYLMLGIALLGPALASFEPAIVAAFVITLLVLRGPLGALVDLVPSFARAGVALNKLEMLGLQLDTVDTSSTASSSLPAHCDEIVVDRVCFEHERESNEREFAIGPIDLRIRRGEVLFITGGNGAGKTTLIKVLTGLYWPKSGGIVVDGIRVGESERDNYRQYFSVVFSDYQLFPHLDPLGEGAAQRAAALLRRFNLSQKVHIEDGEFSTVRLSTGQRKRLALILALLEERDVYVFDEWAADQDPVFRELFYREIIGSLKQRGKAVVAITHDDRYYGVADRILKLSSGQIERATADDLQIARAALVSQP